jgi:hypothetical protein
MSVSTQIVESEVEGMTLTRVMTLLGSPDALKESFKSLKAEIKKANKVKKEVLALETKHTAAVAKAEIERQRDEEQLEVRLRQVEDMESALAELKREFEDKCETSRQITTEAEANLANREQALADRQIDLDKQAAAFAAEREEFEKETAAERVVAINDLADAQEARDKAAAMLYEADEKIAEMRRLVA